MTATDILAIIKDPGLTYHQRMLALAKAAENVPPVIGLSDEAEAFAAKGIIFDMGEGHAPYRPRYILPDFERFLKQGSEFLMLAPARDIREAVDNLLILYHHTPSVTGETVFIGHLDRLLEPFITDEVEARRAIRTLLTHIDRTVSDSFCHCNIGPHDTKAGRIILELSAEMQRPVPNLSLLYTDETPDEFALLAIQTGLTVSKPSFANHRMYAADWGQNYGIVSCYNALPVGGGLTLGRLNLKALAMEASSPQQFLDELLPNAIAAQCEQMEKRCAFIVDECGFYEHSFLVQEGLLSPENFVGMFGMLGLAECVNLLLNPEKPEYRYGHGEAAALFAEQILGAMHTQVDGFESNYCKFYLHAQVGISSDVELSPGTRIPIGEEPDLPQHLRFTARTQKWFPSGTGDLFPFDETAKQNPQAVLDIIKGAFTMDTRYFSFYSADTDVIRVTGYLVKRSDFEAWRAGQAVLASSTPLGEGAADSLGILERKVRTEQDGS
ncbi:MAG: YjjI family glycine radical enzyme [Oscillospiraceae bacterium]|nr:YjjI family glycine radical enzyme [Oscillospiraceae bacterium]